MLHFYRFFNMIQLNVFFCSYNCNLIQIKCMDT